MCRGEEGWWWWWWGGICDGTDGGWSLRLACRTDARMLTNRRRARERIFTARPVVSIDLPGFQAWLVSSSHDGGKAREAPEP